MSEMMRCRVIWGGGGGWWALALDTWVVVEVEERSGAGRKKWNGGERAWVCFPSTFDLDFGGGGGGGFFPFLPSYTGILYSSLHLSLSVPILVLIH